MKRTGRALPRIATGAATQRLAVPLQHAPQPQFKVLRTRREPTQLSLFSSPGGARLVAPIQKKHFPD